MSDETPYSNRELDAHNKELHDKLDLILVQTTKHNSRLTKAEARMGKTEKILLVVGAVSATILMMSGSDLVNIVKTFI